ncbi:MAG TPA: hypothetical protein ENH94_03525 [Phycisphaerales bacterium]|nr:hypothetical protein [Phycisphaerales bacterium]
MLLSIIAAVSYGGYVSIIKLIVYVAMFFAWMPVVNWVHKDTQSVRTKVRLWTLAIVLSGGISLLVWLLAPLFIIGLLVYIIAIGATLVVYVIHRNSIVADFEKIGTLSSIKNIFVNEDKKLMKLSRGMRFITANGNEVPLPRPKSPESFGFGVLCEVTEDAIWRRASDIIFQPQQQEYSVIYKIDGVIAKQPGRTREEIDHLIYYIKQLADLDVKEKRKPQIGPFSIVTESGKMAWEVVTAGSTAGEQLVMRKCEQYSAIKLDDLGLNPSQLKALKSVRDVSSGVTIISGPEKSGVTTTLYAMIRNHDPFMNGINMLERKPAAVLDNITQHEYTLSDTGGKSYSETLRTILRMGPDIVGVGECEDAELAQMSAKAAKDGKIMHITMNANSVVQAVAKWIKLVGDRNLAADTLTAVINQRIIRKLCDDCKQAYKPNPDLLRKFNIPSDKVEVFNRVGEIEYDKHGKPLLCEKCQGTGFYDRTAIFEYILLDDAQRTAIKQAKSLQDIAGSFRRAGMLYIQEESIKKVATGITAINEVIRELSTNSQTAGKDGKK